MWKFRFDTPVGSRLMKQGFIWVTCFPTNKSGNVETPKWSSKTNKWVIDNSWTSTSGEGIRPRCFRAIKRYLRKHPIMSNWQNVPNWSDDQIECFSELGHFNTGFGVLCKGWRGCRWLRLW